MPSDILKLMRTPGSDPSFFSRVFSALCKLEKEKFKKDGDNIKRVCSEEYLELSLRVDRSLFQESTSVRNVLRTRRLANLLIDDEGEILIALLPKAIEYLKQYLCSLGPKRQFDRLRHQHMIDVLNLLLNDKELVKLLKNISLPQSHKVAEQIIRDTLLLPARIQLTNAHVRRAVLSAWLCYLRQNIGSCFATAPAIIVVNEQPSIFLKDLNEILNTGQLKRTFGGKEYSVPLSTSWGGGDLKRTVLLQQNDTQAFENLAHSPGLMEAFVACDLINNELPVKERVRVSQEIVLRELQDLQNQQSVFAVNAEQIIRHALMRHFEITEKDLQDYDSRPKAMIYGGLMMQMSVVGSKGKGDACAQFYTKLDVAKNGFKALADNALLKTWEFTLASFAETKPNFTRWNLYSSLGLSADQKGGIGECMYHIIKLKLDQSNEKTRDYQMDYELVYNQLKYIEARVRNASSEKELQWIRIEYQTKKQEFDLMEELRNKEHYKAERFANLFNELMDIYDALFPVYFQEVYDPEMHAAGEGPYDDSPAGFRLLYKHGRSNTSLWTKIYSPQEFIDALSAFFIATERDVTDKEEYKDLQTDLSEIITAIVTHIKTDEFLVTAFDRMAIAHQTKPVENPLEHLDKIDKKPWAYTSGGGMSNLISCYFRLEDKPSEVSRWVENEIELLVFLIDSIKKIPYKTLEEFSSSPNRSLLMHSPTHAFTLKPSYEALKKALQNESFTYTWVRDQYVKPMQLFVEYMFLDTEMQSFLVEQLFATMPEQFRLRIQNHVAEQHTRMNPPEFRRFILNFIESDHRLKFFVNAATFNVDDIDSNLYSLLPLFSSTELRNRIEKIYSQLPFANESFIETAIPVLDEIVDSIPFATLMSAKSLLDISKAALALIRKKPSSQTDDHLLISQAAQALGYAMPKPILFADTNWVLDQFAFLVNPGTGSLELWRVDYTGTTGSPMSSWKKWLNGSRKDILWGIYDRPYEYR